jgi:large subunit ribosomal protein L4
LIIVDDEISLPDGATPHLIKHIFKANSWGRGNGRSTLITDRKDDDLFAVVNEMHNDAKILDREDVDVKGLLETGRLIIEKRALDRILAQHSKDLKTQPAKARY